MHDSTARPTLAPSSHSSSRQGDARQRRRDVLAGARAMTPWLAGIVPFGLVIGVHAAQAGVPTFAGWLTGPLLFGGSAQVVVIDLLDAGATPAVVIVAALAVNLRLVLYSATMAPHWRGTPTWFQALAAYLLIDPTLSVGVDGYERDTDRHRGHRHYLGAAALLWVAWLAAIAAGATLGARLPAALHLELVIPLFLAGEVASRLTSRAATQAATAAGVVATLAVVAGPVPLHLGPVLAIAAGVGAGLRAERLRAEPVAAP
jgi:predicted branched-subunit amino acid permease